MNKLNTCCFTGHRPESLYINGESESSVYEKILKAVQDAIESGYTDFLCGGARGGDLLFAEAVISEKRYNPHIKLICVLPHRAQSSGWNYEDRETYSNILEASDKIVCLHEKYTKGCMHERNKYMVDRSSYLIATYNGTKGGTEFTLKYAKKCGLKTLNLIDIITDDQSGQLSF